MSSIFISISIFAPSFQTRAHSILHLHLHLTMTPPEVAMHNDSPEPFPSLTDPPSPKSPGPDHNRSRQTSSSSTIQGRLRSVSKNFQESSPPTGMCIATAQIASSVPSLSDIRRGSYNSDGWSGEGQIREKERRASLSARRGSQTGEERRGSLNPHSPKDSGPQFGQESVPEVEESGSRAMDRSPPRGTSNKTNKPLKPVEMETRVEKNTSAGQRSSSDTNLSPNTAGAKTDAQYITTPFDNGYQFPPKHPWTESTAIFLIAFWKFFITPIGFLVVIYVGMLRLLIFFIIPYSLSLDLDFI